MSYDSIDKPGHPRRHFLKRYRNNGDQDPKSFSPQLPIGESSGTFGDGLAQSTTPRNSSQLQRREK